jgi:thiol:disulfide interchange protein
MKRRSTAVFAWAVLVLALAAGAASGQLVQTRPDLLSATAVSNYEAVRPGQNFTVAVRIRVGKGAWVYGPEPGGKIIPAQPLSIELPKEGAFAFGAVRWPKTTRHTTDLGGQTDQHNVYTGEQTILVPVLAKSGARFGSYDLRFRLRGQVCTPGTCIPVEAVASVRLSVAEASRESRYKLPQLPFVHGSAAKPTGSAPSFDVTKNVRVETPKTPWILAILAALLGGVVLNFMPCVLPVVPIKVYSFLEHAQRDPRKALRLSLAFALGMIAVFLALGVFMASVRGLWGMQFQRPEFVTALGALVFTMGLWLGGAFTITLPQSLTGARFSAGEYLGSVGMGALATVLATPCSGPFLGGALAWAATQPAPVVLATFAAIGVGMASPYVVLVAQPNLLKRLPRPGPWMETWKQGMALLMFAVTVYFVSVLPAERHVPFLLLCLAIAAGVWVANRWGGINEAFAKRTAARLVAFGLIAAGVWAAYSPRMAQAGISSSEAASIRSGELTWNSFDIRTLNRWLSGGQTVIVEWTADWCPNCKYVENTVYRNREVVQRLKQGVKLMRADITRPFPEAERLLKRLGGRSIPFTAVFPAEDPSKPRILRDIYTPEALLKALE